MTQIESVQALAGIGLEGDRYATGKGAYSQAKKQKIRHVSLIAREAIAQANTHLLLPYTEAQTRRNIVTEGADLNQLVGKTFWLGQAVLYGTELCDPCKRPEKLTGQPGFEQAFQQLGGLRAEVLQSGLVRVQDTLQEVALHDLIPAQVINDIQPVIK